MDTQLIELSAAGVALVPVVIGLTQLLKAFVPERFQPLVALALGIGGAFVPGVVGGVLFLGSPILGGIVVGLLASGLYSQTVTLAGK